MTKDAQHTFFSICAKLHAPLPSAHRLTKMNLWPPLVCIVYLHYHHGGSTNNSSLANTDPVKAPLLYTHTRVTFLPGEDSVFFGQMACRNPPPAFLHPHSQRKRLSLTIRYTGGGQLPARSGCGWAGRLNIWLRVKSLGCSSEIRSQKKLNARSKVSVKTWGNFSLTRSDG